MDEYKLDKIWKISYTYAGVHIIVCSMHGFDLVTQTTQIEEAEGECEFCILVGINKRWMEKIPPGS